MYAQHVGLNGSTVEMCSSLSLVPHTEEDPQTRCGPFLRETNKVGRAGARRAQYITVWSTLLYDVANRHDLLRDQLELYRRGAVDAPRPACCPPPFDVANNWMQEYPQAYVIPFGEGQRSNPEANRLVDWLLFNGAEIDVLAADYAFGGQTFEAGSYVLRMNQVRRGLIDTALGLGRDVSDEISILYAPPASWSHGYLWGADVVTVPDGAAFAPATVDATAPNKLHGGIAAGKKTNWYALALDSPTAVRTSNTLIAGGLEAKLATGSFRTSPGGVAPAGSLLFPASAVQRLDTAGKQAGVSFLQHRELAVGGKSDRPRPADVVLRFGRRLHRRRHRRRLVPDRRGTGRGPHGASSRRLRPERDRHLEQLRRRRQRGYGRLPERRHRDHGSADVVHVGAELHDGRCHLAADRVLPLGSLEQDRADRRRRLGGGRARHEHLRHGADHVVRDEPAVPRRPRARMADARRVGVLGRQVALDLRGGGRRPPLASEH
jgi:hypothetical protein